MEERTIKILIDKKDDVGLFVFRQFGRTEFVVAGIEGNPMVGDVVDSWFSGHYFSTLKDAQSYFREKTY